MKLKVLPLTIIIPTYERPSSLSDTLKSMNSFDYIASEIIVIDQSISFKKQNFTECSKYNNVKYIWSDIASLTRARNIGLNKAKNNLIIYSDDDINIESETLKNVFDIMSKPEYALIGGLDINTINKKSSPFSYIVGKKSFKKRKIGHMTKSIFGRYPDKVSKETLTEWAMGYFFCIKKDICLNSNILFDEKLKKYAYAEDLDFTYRYCKYAKNSNLKTIITPKVLVNHKVTHEYRTPSEKFIKYLFLNRAYIAQKLNIQKNFFNIKWANFWIKVEAKLKKEKMINYKNAKKELNIQIKNNFKNFNS